MSCDAMASLCHRERSEAIQSHELDCFVASLLAMTVIMRIAFMGTPEFAVPTLDRLAESDHDLVAVYTQPPRPAGRGKASRPSPVQLRAEALGIEVRTPKSLNGQAEQAEFAARSTSISRWSRPTG
ncbi:MAG TPA: hypothetical protein VLJ84_05850, partial [Usitatibacter sp.]|nr:hypothetical protein [Usitatibacter sp.]